VALEQVGKVGWASDPADKEMYVKIPPGPRSTHNLPKWSSDRAESALEKFHELLAHYGNTRTSKILADIIAMGGVAEWNVVCRWKEHVNRAKLEGQKLAIDAQWEDEPLFWDHSLLSLVNGMADRQGLARPFDFVTPIGDDNGEVFLSEYFLKQMERNETLGQDSLTSMCKCTECKSYLPIRIDRDGNEGDCCFEIPKIPQSPPKKSPPKPPPVRTENHVTAMIPAKSTIAASQPSYPAMHWQILRGGFHGVCFRPKGKPPHSVGCAKRK